METPYYLINSFTVEDPESREQIGGNSAAVLFTESNHDGSLTRMEQGVPSQPCCVEAQGQKEGERIAVFIGGTGVEKERGKISISAQSISRKPSP